MGNSRVLDHDRCYVDAFEEDLSRFQYSWSTSIIVQVITIYSLRFRIYDLIDVAVQQNPGIIMPSNVAGTRVANP